MFIVVMQTPDGKLELLLCYNAGGWCCKAGGYATALVANNVMYSNATVYGW